jgi:hypothetical protein
MLYINCLVKWGHMAVVPLMQHMERAVPLTAAVPFAHSVCMFNLNALDIDLG